MTASGFCLRQNKEKHRVANFFLLLWLHLQVFLIVDDRMNGKIN